MKKEYYIFDITKFILSLLIVQIHIGLFSTYNIATEELFKNLIGRYAVPLFFMISSYLLFDKIDKDHLFSLENKYIYNRYISRLLILYTSWLIIYFISLKFIFNMDISITQFISSYFTDGLYRQFWYLNAQILGTILFLILLRSFSINKILIISIILYIFGLILVPYNSIFIKIFPFIPKYEGNVLMCRNFLTFALVYISIGYYINLLKTKKINIKLMSYLSAIFFILSIIEFIYLKNIDCKYYALLIFILLSSSCICTILPRINLKPKKIYIKLRKYSILIYCLHTLIYLFLEKGLSKYPLFNNSIIMYITTVITCIIISELIMYIDKKIIKLKFLY